jgi:hypothetical protein
LEVGKTLSKGERDDKDLNEEKSLIYGEVDYSSFYRVLRKINPAAGGTFYDLGSGTGKAVIAARLACDFSRCLGIEILESLHTQGAMIMNRFNDNYQDLLSAGMHQMAAVFEGSFLSYDWSDGDVVFANSTCYDEKLMADMARMARALKPGAFFVTFTKGLNIPDAFEVIERKRYRMSWGPATVFIHRRLNDDGSSAGPFKLNLLPSDEVSYSDDEDNDKWKDSDSSDDDYSSDDEDEDDDDDDDDEDDDDEDDGDEDDDDDDDSGEIDYEAYLRDRAKFYSDYDGMDDDDDDDDDEDYEPESGDEDEDDSDSSYATASDEEEDEDEEFDQADFYKAMNILNLGGSQDGGSGSRSGSNKSTPNSSRSASNKSTPSSYTKAEGKSTPPRTSPGQNMATPPSYHSAPRVSPSSGKLSSSPQPLQVKVPAHLQSQSFQESIGSPQDAALLRKKNRSRVASKNKAIGAGY